MISRAVVEDEDVYFGEEAEDGFRGDKLCYALKKLLRARARSASECSHGSDGFTISKAACEIGTCDELLNEAELAAQAEEKETHSFEID